MQAALRGCRGACKGAAGSPRGGGERGPGGGGRGGGGGGGVTGHRLSERLLPGQSPAKPGGSRTLQSQHREGDKRLRFSPNRTDFPNQVHSTQVRPSRVPTTAPSLGPAESRPKVREKEAEEAAAAAGAENRRQHEEEPQRETGEFMSRQCRTPGPVGFFWDWIRLEHIPPKLQEQKL